MLFICGTARHVHVILQVVGGILTVSHLTKAVCALSTKGKLGVRELLSFYHNRGFTNSCTSDYCLSMLNMHNEVDLYINNVYRYQLVVFFTINNPQQLLLVTQCPLNKKKHTDALITGNQTLATLWDHDYILAIYLTRPNPPMVIGHLAFYLSCTLL